MSRRLLAPGEYIQGRSILGTRSLYDPLDGSSAFVLGGETALQNSVGDLRAGLESAGYTIEHVEAGVDSCTFEVIDSLAASAKEYGADTVVGVGGGVALDTSKGVAETLGAELVTVPTIASTDAPCSSVAVVYDSAGRFDGYVHRSRDPDLVVVDTSLIARAPTRFLRYGMGDAFATRFEAEAVSRSGAQTHAGGRSTDAALTLARRTYQNLETHGESALAAVERDSVTPAVDRIVETNTLLSGVGFESSGLAAAHAFGKGFSRSGADGPHGLLIAFSTIAELVLEERDAEILWGALDLYHSLGLDRRLEDFGISESAIETVAENACAEDTTMSNEPVPVTPVEAAAALRTADELIASY